MKKIKIIFANRKNCFIKPGGDTMQMMKTKQYLENKYDVEVKICLTPEEIEQNNDAKIVHIFNLETINETNAFIKSAKKSNKKIVLSTIHWNLLNNYYVKYLEVLNLPPIQTFTFIKWLVIKIFNLFILLLPTLRKKYENYINKGLYCTSRYKKERIKALKNADLLLPNSTEEMVLCAKDFNLNQKYIAQKSKVIPNATDLKLKIENSSQQMFFDSLKLPPRYVLIAGRIEAAKNQYNLIKALYNNKDIGIVIIGHVENNKTKQRIDKLAKRRGNVFFVEKTSQENLIMLYKNALCHCLPSFSDTTGLVNIEALLCGCPILTSSKEYCPVMFYEFDKFGEQCNPYNHKSIKDAIFRIINKKQRIELPEGYKQKFSYENVADLSFKAYISLII